MSNLKRNQKSRTALYTASVAQFKISLAGEWGAESVWRRIQVPINITFQQFSRVIDDAMGWKDRQEVHLFVFGPDERGWKKDIGPAERFDCLNEEKERIGKHFELVPSKLAARYGCGIGGRGHWEHSVVLEELVPAEPSGTYPRLIAGKRACPPEECEKDWDGGWVGCYHGLLDALADPDDAVMEWLEQSGYTDFDPARFDKEEVEFRKVWTARAQV